MFNFIHCESNLTDVVITIIVLYSLYITDLVLTFINLKGLKKLYPKNYLSYEKNIIVKFLIKRLGINFSMCLYFIIGLILFSILLFYMLNPSLILGILVSLVFLIHFPNFFEIKKRLKKRGIE
jgi:hypothetical protein